MLKQNSLSKKQTNDILSLISLLALNPNRVSYEQQISIYDKYISKKINNFLNKSHINQYNLPTLRNSKIVLSKKVYKTLLKLAKKSNRYQLTGEEFGCYLFGKKESKTIYFDQISKHKSPKTKNRFNTTHRMQEEITDNMNNSNINFICHVHTHPNNTNTYGSTPSNQDLYTYAWLQEQLSNNDVNFLGALIAPPDNQSNFNDICFIYYNKDNKKFYKITNIYYQNKKEEIPLQKAKINQIIHPILLNVT